MTSSKALFYICLAFIAGIVLPLFIKIPQGITLGFLMVGVLVVFIPLLLGQRKYAVIGFCLLALVLGILRLEISQFNEASDQVRKLNDAPEKITLIGQIISEPDIRDNSQRLKIKISKTESIVLVTIQRYPEYHYLDVVEVTGKLKTPGVFEGFNYQQYLQKEGIYSVMDFPLVELIEENHHYTPTTFLYEKILWLKHRLSEPLNTHFSGPDSAIMQGIVFGNDKNMSDGLKEQFRITGLSHVTAVSGSNIVILISLFMSALLALGFWRSQAFYGSVILIWLYIIMIGLPVSGIRAAIMGSVALLAQHVGRQNTGTRVLVLTACLMLLQNPLLLLYDIGFQLSFLASLGILHAKPLIDYYFKIIFKERFKSFLDIISVTFAAQIFTLPIIVYNFGQISVIAPITNILVLPMIPLLTIIGFAVSLVGIMWNVTGFIISLPAVLLLAYFTKILGIFSQPWAVMTLENISFGWIGIYYIVLAIVIWRLAKYQRQNFVQ